MTMIPHQQQAAAWLAGEDRFLTLTGPHGTGKTFTALSMRWPPPPLVLFKSLVNAWGKEPWAGWPERARLVILDDVYPCGPGMYRQDPKEVFSAVVEEISTNHGERLIITSNMPTKEFRKWAGERVWDRLSGHGEMIQVLGESRRGKHGDAGPNHLDKKLKMAWRIANAWQQRDRLVLGEWEGTFVGITITRTGVGNVPALLFDGPSDDIYRACREFCPLKLNEQIGAGEARRIPFMEKQEFEEVG